VIYWGYAEHWKLGSDLCALEQLFQFPGQHNLHARILRTAFEINASCDGGGSGHITRDRSGTFLAKRRPSESATFVAPFESSKGECEPGEALQH
jgi:hypothetical protein